MLTQPLLDSLFDRAFSKRTFSVQFLFNPNLRQFKQAAQSWEVDPSGKPLLFLYAERLDLLDKYGEGLRDMLLSDYANVFDCYFGAPNDWPQTSKLFAAKDIPMFCPLLYIIDKQDKPKKVSKEGNLLGLLDPTPDLNNFYFRKYRPDYVWYGEQFEE